jgi:hypothetical protein
MLDFQKEREAFELWAIKASGGWASFSKSHGDAYANNKLQFAWETWLAAKAQAVPEGFVLVPREPTEEMLGAAWEAPPAGEPSGNRRTFYERQAVVYKAMVEEAEKEMIEAQEQGHV